MSVLLCFVHLLIPAPSATAVTWGARAIIQQRIRNRSYNSSLLLSLLPCNLQPWVLLCVCACWILWAKRNILNLSLCRSAISMSVKSLSQSASVKKFSRVALNCGLFFDILEWIHFLESAFLYREGKENGKAFWIYSSWTWGEYNYMHTPQVELTLSLCAFMTLTFLCSPMSFKVPLFTVRKLPVQSPQ